MSAQEQLYKNLHRLSWEHALVGARTGGLLRGTVASPPTRGGRRRHHTSAREEIPVAGTDLVAGCTFKTHVVAVARRPMVHPVCHWCVDDVFQSKGHPVDQLGVHPELIHGVELRVRPVRCWREAHHRHREHKRDGKNVLERTLPEASG